MVDFVGGSGDDAWAGTEQSDTAEGNGGSDSLIGNGGNDVLAGGVGADYLDGGDGDDILFSHNRDPAAFAFISYRGVSDDFGTEVDTLIGGAGDDYIIAGYGDNVDGGTQGSYGNRLYISFQGASSGVSADFRLLQSTGSITIGGGVITNIQTIGYLEGSEYDDFLVPIDTYYPTGANVYGRGGNDHIIGDYYSGWGGSALYGGDGNDIVDARTSQYGPAVYGDAGDDTLYTSSNGFSIAYGGDGNDTIYAAVSEGGAGNDTFYLQYSFYGRSALGGTGDDTFHATIYGDASAFGGEGADTFYGAEGNDTFEGGADNDRIIGGGGSNTLRGDAGNDRFEVGTSDSGTLIEGGADFDTLAVSGTFTIGGASSGIEVVELNSGTLNLSSSQFANALSATTQLMGTGGIVVTSQPGFAVDASGFSLAPGAAVTLTVNGSVQGDTITGVNGITNILNGAGGNDTLQGGSGNDTLDGGAGVNSLFGGSGNDRLMVDASGAGSSFDGQAGTDTLAVSGAVSLGSIAGIEAVDLAAGSNLTLSASQVMSGLSRTTALSGSGTVTVNLEAGVTLAITGFQSVGAPISFVINGSSGSDFVKAGHFLNTISGGDGQDFLRGGNLVDTIDGGADRDKLTGWGGADVLTGGGGNDQFRYLFASDSGVGAAADRITDFTIGSDVIDLRLLDSDLVTPGIQNYALGFIGSAAFGASGASQVRYGTSGSDMLVQVDLDGNGSSDMEIVLQGLAGQTLSASDFMFAVSGAEPLPAPKGAEPDVMDTLFAAAKLGAESLAGNEPLLTVSFVDPFAFPDHGLVRWPTPHWDWLPLG